MTRFLPSVHYPNSRPRRNRRDDFTRRLVREHHVTANDFIYPVFVREGENVKENVDSMPGVYRYSPDTLFAESEESLNLGIPVLSLFPSIEPSLKTADGSEAANPYGLHHMVVSDINKRFPELVIFTYVA